MVAVPTCSAGLMALPPLPQLLAPPTRSSPQPALAAARQCIMHMLVRPPHLPLLLLPSLPLGPQAALLQQRPPGSTFLRRQVAAPLQLPGLPQQRHGSECPLCQLHWRLWDR